MKLYVKTNTRTIESYREPVDYGDWHEVSEFQLNSIHINEPFISSYAPGFEVFEVDFEANVGDMIYAIYIIYSTGDSFGQSNGNGEVMWLFKDPTVAAKALQKIDAGRQQYSIKFETDGGKTVTISNPAAGYFEHMDDLQLWGGILQM